MHFHGSFTQQEALSEESIEAAISILKTGRLHRYNTQDEEISEVAKLEYEFAAYQKIAYCLACASGGYAMQIALRALGMSHGEPVLTNAFTLSPVPGSIYAAGGVPIFVEITQNLVLDLKDLEQKIHETGASILLISHMRGHLVDMDALVELLEKYNIKLIEDCAHTMGSTWAGKKSGTFGVAGCYSTQTYKHINAGEGGLLTSDDSEFMARAIVLSGSYMFYDRHLASPSAEVFDNICLDTPNCSGRMDNLRAAILRPQLLNLNNNIPRWNQRYQIVEKALSCCSFIYLPQRPEEERYVGSSIQFLIPKISSTQAQIFLQKCHDKGVVLKWFGGENPIGFTSRHQNWQYLKQQSLPQSDNILDVLFDMRIPLTFNLDNCQLIGKIIVACLQEIVLVDNQHQQ